MPPRRGRGRRGGSNVKRDDIPQTDNAATNDAEMNESVTEANGGASEVAEPMEQDPAENSAAEQNGQNDEFKPSENDLKYPHQIKVTHLPANNSPEDLQKYIAATFKVLVPLVTSIPENDGTLVVHCESKDDQETLTRFLNSHVWRRKAIRAAAWLPLESSSKRKLEDGADDAESKKLKMEESDALTLEDEVISETLPLFHLSYPEQKKDKPKRIEKPWMNDEIREEILKSQKLYRARVTHPNDEQKLQQFKNHRNNTGRLIKAAKENYELDSAWFIDLATLEADDETKNILTMKEATLMSHRLHGLLCQRNPALAGWAEKNCDDNGGTIFKVDPLKISPQITGYRNKCKFRVGKNSDGESTVGLSLNDNETKVLEVQPGDKLIHLPDCMKYAAKKFQVFIRAHGKEPFDKKKKTGVWDAFLVRVAPDQKLMVVCIVNTISIDEKALAELKKAFTEFFTTGEGSDCGVFSIYFQAFQNHHPSSASDKLEHLWGGTDYEEVICGRRFHVSANSILSFAPRSYENVYNSVIELAEPTRDSVVIDACAGSCGIAFTLADKCEKVYAIEPQAENVRDATKSLELNGLKNVEIIKGKCEENMEKIFQAEKEKKIIVILDPPRHGVPSKASAIIRAQPSVTKLIYICSNSKIGVKNFLDFCAPAGKDTQTGLDFEGLPFLPTRIVSIDQAPFTVHNIVTVLLERIDPSTYPAATKPPPEPIKPAPPKKKSQPVKRRQRPTPQGGLRGVRGGGVRGARGRGMGARFQSQAYMRSPFGAPPLMGKNMGPPRGMRGGPGPRGGGRFMEQNNLISKYERRIAELEQQDRAFKAGLSMGLQAMSRGGGTSTFTNNSSPRNMGDYATGDAFGGYRGGYKDPYGDNSNSVWLSGSAPYNTNTSNTYNNSYGGVFSRDGNYENTFGSQVRTAGIAGSRFMGMNSAAGNSGSNRGTGRGGGSGYSGGRGFGRGGGANRRGGGGRGRR